MYMEHSTRYQFAAQSVKGKRVLDVGCGVGYGSQLLATAGASDVWALDLSPEAIAHAEAHYTAPNLRFVNASAENFAFPEQQFDVVTCFELIEHVHRPSAVLTQIKRHLAPGGLLLITTPRHLGHNRSAFHTREFYWHDFRTLLSGYFRHLQPWVQNNHLASLITDRTPESLPRIFAMADVFHPESADYFVVVASDEEIPRFRSAITLEDESYVKLLERDVDILHAAENRLQADILKLQQQVITLQASLSHEEQCLAEARLHNRQLITSLENSVSSHVLTELKAVHQEAIAAARREIERLQGELERVRLNESELQRIEANSVSKEVLEAAGRLHQEQMVAANRQIVELQSALAEARQTVEKLELAMGSMVERSVHEQMIRHHDQQALTARQETGELLGQLATLNSENTRLARQCDQAEAKLGELNNAIAALQLKVQDHDQGGAQASAAQRKALEATLAERDETIKQLTQRLSVTEIELRNARTEAERSGGRVARMTNSLSWQITWPLRATPKLLRRTLAAVRGDASAPAATGPATAPACAAPGRPKDIRNTLHRMPADFETASGPLEVDFLYIVGCLEGESKRYRVYNVIEALIANGRKCAALYEIDVDLLIQRGLSCRAIILFRAAHSPFIERLAAFARAQGIPLIFDVDDLVFEPEHIDWVRAIGHFTPEQRREYLSGVTRYRRTLELCQAATTTTRVLQERLVQTGRPAAVIPNGLNARQMALADDGARPSRDDNTIRIAYFSGSKTHQVDFAQCEEALLRIMEKYASARFVVVGMLDLSARWDGLAARLERHDFMPYCELLRLQKSIDINLAPLELGNPYCEGKSQLKYFEAAVVGVPTIASATQSFREVMIDGEDGRLCITPEDWFAALDELCRDAEQRTKMGDAARRRARENFGPEAIRRAATAAYDLLLRQSPPAQVETAPRLRITWVIPGLIIGGGGHRNILRAAHHLERFGHQLELYFTNVEYSPEQLHTLVREHFYPLDCPMHPYQGVINQTDILFATHWTTVDAALLWKSAARHVFYFVQDFEPAFAPMGSEYILAENTYRKGLYHICSGPWCEQLLKRRFHAKADHFVFPIDTSVYHARPRNSSANRLLFFAKPEMPRRCYELGIFALSRIAALRPDLEIVLFGSNTVKNKSIPFKARVEGILPGITDLADLYSSATAGIVFSTTNPSLVPYEMMACGLPVIDLNREGNEVNYAGRTDIARLVDPEPDVMADQILRLLDSPEELARRSQAGLEFVRTFPDEEGMARRIEQLILAHVATH
jgi:glycosyltransferase involved in cell wall biosynthesis/ubiquinone/menaquinone biosynthesis C-methylase UbiE